MSEEWDVNWTSERVLLHNNITGKNWTYELVSPPCCNICGKELVRGKCWDYDRHSNLVQAERTFQMGFYFPSARQELQASSDILSQHILNLKDHSQYARPIGTAMAMTLINNYKEMLNVQFFVPVPSYGTDCNHAASLCEIISKHVENTLGIKIPVQIALNKIKNITLHKLRSRSERQEAVIGMFTPSSSISVVGKDIVLVDDLLTTADTKSECIKILKMHGAKRIWVFVAAGNV